MSKNYIFTENTTLLQVFFTHFANKNQLPGFFISETLACNGITDIRIWGKTWFKKYGQSWIHRTSPGKGAEKWVEKENEEKNIIQYIQIYNFLFYKINKRFCLKRFWKHKTFKVTSAGDFFIKIMSWLYTKLVTLFEKYISSLNSQTSNSLTSFIYITA